MYIHTHPRNLIRCVLSSTHKEKSHLSSPPLGQISKPTVFRSRPKGVELLGF